MRNYYGRDKNKNKQYLESTVKLPKDPLNTYKGSSAQETPVEDNWDDYEEYISDIGSYDRYGNCTTNYD